MSTKTKKVTINDVARMAGVSKRTVSRVINGSPLVGEETRKRIENVIESVSFQPDKQARGLASKRSYLLGLVYDNPDALYIDQVQRGALSICSELGYELVVHPCKWHEPDFVDNCLKFIARSNVDGLLILPPVSESKLLAKALQDADHPYVRIASADLDDHDNIVISNERAAMAEIVEHLVELGHNNIAMITGPLHYYSSQERLGGFKTSAQKAGLTLADNHIVEGKNNYESGLACAEQLLSLPQRPSAIFANNDEMAAGVLRVAHTLGIKVPEQLSVIGFDDNLFASRVIPSLTTMRRPVEKLAMLATQKLVGHFQHDGISTKVETIVDPYLIKRESTAKPQDKGAATAT
ncbi:LacI family DNA-binding transcriptional regulator [Shewanella sp. C32]|uniref:LacI family DNA-binding transcriptional regulator n=1 Tax=Shewanella electrica TaxID=515560 RepID=A0ABT2FM98_9GAMM|nr:LacI family DNA-binding transcriptional regulator [Shewanella electrica]MCH1924435.1 LacI family DNA-binding transcriptional regulator [Shewanella electrica]MCS4556336.1 LacI family DNA-binding transcriptional regulator [Shewanella electrica]